MIVSAELNAKPGRKSSGGTSATDAGVSIVDGEGRRVGVEITSVPIYDGEHVVGVFRQVSDIVEEPHTHPERGRSTKQIADDLHLSPETVRNDVRHVLRAVGAHSRLEAVAIANGAY